MLVGNRYDEDDPWGPWKRPPMGDRAMIDLTRIKPGAACRTGSYEGICW